MLLLTILNTLCRRQQRRSQRINLVSLSWIPQPQLAATVDRILDTPTFEHLHMPHTTKSVVLCALALVAVTCYLLAG